MWHPGQPWIWKAGGLGVFDPGINALSILTSILPSTLSMRSAQLCYPRNCETPIAAQLVLADTNGVRVDVELDFLQTGPPMWDIEVETDLGGMRVSMGGTAMTVGNRPIETQDATEYGSMYAHFADLIRRRALDVDVAPLQLVADALLCGQRIDVEPFIE